MEKIRRYARFLALGAVFFSPLTVKACVEARILTEIQPPSNRNLSSKSIDPTSEPFILSTPPTIPRESTPPPIVSELDRNFCPPPQDSFITESGEEYHFKSWIPFENAISFSSIEGQTTTMSQDSRRLHAGIRVVTVDNSTHEKQEDFLPFPGSGLVTFSPIGIYTLDLNKDGKKLLNAGLELIDIATLQQNVMQNGGHYNLITKFGIFAFRLNCDSHSIDVSYDFLNDIEYWLEYVPPPDQNPKNRYRDNNDPIAQLIRQEPGFWD